MVKALYNLKDNNMAPVEELVSKNIGVDEFKELMQNKVVGAVRTCKRLESSTAVSKEVYCLSALCCCDCRCGKWKHRTWVDVASNVSRGLLLWCVPVAAAAHYLENRKGLDSVYFGTSTVSTCGYGDMLVNGGVSRTLVVLVQLWMMFGQQALLLPWVCCDKAGRRCSLGNPVFLIVAKISVFLVALLLLHNASCNESWSVGPQPPIWDLVYFLTTSMSTVGYGDVYPLDTLGKTVTMLLHLAMLVMDLFAPSFDDVAAELADV